jgi:hypothetical protein
MGPASGLPLLELPPPSTVPELLAPPSGPELPLLDATPELLLPPELTPLEPLVTPLEEDVLSPLLLAPPDDVEEFDEGSLEHATIRMAAETRLRERMVRIG